MIFGGIFTSSIFGSIPDKGVVINAPALSYRAEFSHPTIALSQVVSAPVKSYEAEFPLPEISIVNIITIDASIATGPDDCAASASSFLNGSINVTVGAGWTGGLRFADLQIPQSASIISAKITVHQRNANATYPGTWHAWAIDDAPQFSALQKPQDVEKTTASAPLVPSPTPGSSYVDVEHDVTSIVQEIVDRAGWNDGNAINFIATSSVSSNDGFYAYERSTSLCARLSIEILSPDNFINVPVLRYGVQLPAPILLITSKVDVPTLVYEVEFPAPTLVLASVVEAPALEAEAFFPLPSIFLDVVITPPTLACEASLPQPSITQGTAVNGPALNYQAGFPVPGFIIDQVISAPELNCQIVFPAPSLYQDQILTGPILGYAAVFPAPSVSFSVEIDAPTLVYEVEHPLPSILIDQVISAPALGYEVLFPEPTISTLDVTLDAPVLGCEVTLPVPAIVGDFFIEVPMLEYSVSFPHPVIEVKQPNFEGEPGREPVTVIEIDQDFCSLVYGESPCMAALGTTGARKCFNTLKTCQDVANFDKSILTLRFCSPSVSADKKVRAIPTVMSVSTNPTEINVGGGDINQSPLGRRASITVEFRDIPYNDRLVDKYRTERSYKPETRGTFWSKWLARNPYYQNRPLRVREGYIGQSLESMRTRHYFIDKIEGPDSNGRVRITAKDVLKFADNKKAQCPRPSNGRLDRDIDNNDTAFTLLPEDIGGEYPSSGIGIIGDELVSFTRSGDNITLTQRGLRDTEATDHDEDDSFQIVQVFDGVRVDEVIKTLLEDFANVPSEYIPFSDWQAEAARWLTGYELNTWITEPTGVSDLLGELLQQCICYIWWDEYDQEIKFKPIRPIDPETDTLKIVDEDSNIVAESVRVDRDPDQRLSQVWFFYRQNNPVEDLEDPANYGRLSIRADLEAETDLQYGESRIAKIYSRWFTAANSGQVITTGTQLLLRYRDNPLIVTLSLDAKDRDLKTGDVVRVTHRSIVDETGQPIPTLLQVIKTHESAPGHKVDYKCQVFGFIQRYGFIMANDAPSYEDSTEDQRNNGMWISENEEPYFPDGSDAYRII